MPGSDLPIEAIRSDLKTALKRYKRFVLEAPTGSGKSTQTPQMLLDEGLAGDGCIVILQPRRIATRMLAKRIASERCATLGDEVGYQIRFDNKASRDTRILFLTEGILLRKMLGDSFLHGIAAILFDEFHERNLFSDLSLSMAMRIQEQSRPDLILGVMSATLDGDKLQTYLNPCARLQCKGRTFPVDISYTTPVKNNREIPIWEKAAIEFSKAVNQGKPGNALIFMPGAYEIARTIRCLEATSESRDFEVLSLHGELPPDQQDRAIAKSNNRKVIVSTNVAETSLTIPDIGIVIDSGQARIPSYDPRRGVNTLLVQAISQASAAQRSGRAGREMPGYCVRLWGENQHKHRPLFEQPEIHRVDLTETLLMLKASGLSGFSDFRCFDPPTTVSVDHAETLLHDLGAVDTSGQLTELGRKMAAFPLHPRYSRLFIEAEARGCLHPAVELAALSQDRPILLPVRDKRDQERRDHALQKDLATDSDIFLELRAFQLARERNFNTDYCRSLSIHAGAARMAHQAAQQFLGICRAQDLIPEPVEWSDWNALGKCLLTAFSDQLAKRLDEGTLRCELVHGKRGTRRRESLVESECFLSTDIEERNVQGSVQLMLGRNTPVELEWIEELFPDEITSSDGVFWDPWQKRIRKVARRSFRGIALTEKESLQIDKDEATTILAQQVAEGSLKLKRWNHKVESLIERINFISRHFPEYEIAPIRDEDRLTLMEQICYGAMTAKDLDQAEVLPVITEWLTQEQLAMLDPCAPEIIQTEKGRLKIRYEQGRAILSARIQQLYDQASIRIADRVPVLYEILAPNQRPVQITEDLEAFWSSSYPAIRKELKGRYPKHEWR